jgi:hypothetical protein
VPSRQLLTFTVNGNTTVKAQAVLPAGAIFRGITLDTPAAVGGTPSSCNFRCGTADTGQQVTADVDAKAQGHISTTVVAALDKVGGFSAADTTLFAQVTTAGGTSSTGTIYAFVDYDAPVR